MNELWRGKMPCHKLYKDKGALEIWQEEMAHVDMYIKHL